MWKHFFGLGFRVRVVKRQREVVGTVRRSPWIQKGTIVLRLPYQYL